MKILLDECMPRKLKKSLYDHECQTVPEAGLAGQKNGTLLSLAQTAGFELSITMDKGLQYQQNLAGRRIAILIVRAKSNRWLPRAARFFKFQWLRQAGRIQRKKFGRDYPNQFRHP